jgi:3-hydroxyacyl-CoA dehydrogenase / 3-hydroxy-2-methylbutyryl-CoA dehydrogenase
MDVRDSVAVITGGASGLGEATTRMLIAGGGQVVILDLPSSKGDDLVAELGPAATFIATDVTDEAQVAAAFDQIGTLHNRLDLCLNAAGNGPGHRVVRRDGVLFPLDLYRRTVELNLIGAFDVLRHAAAKMAQNEPGQDGERGLIINVASVAATEGQVGQAAYSASKGALIASTLPLARDLEVYGIRVMTISPGLMNTPLVASAGEKLLDALANVPLFPHRFGTADEFAALVRHIMENRLLNAETIRLDAGTRLTAR